MAVNKDPQSQKPSIRRSIAEIFLLSEGYEITKKKLIFSHLNYNPKVIPTAYGSLPEKVIEVFDKARIQ